MDASEIETKLLERALEFYLRSPDGQYDEIAALCILAELKRREKTAE